MFCRAGKNFFDWKLNAFYKIISDIFMHEKAQYIILLEICGKILCNRINLNVVLANQFRIM